LQKNKNIDDISNKNKELVELQDEYDEKQEDLVNSRKKIGDSVDLLDIESKKIESLTDEIEQKTRDLTEVRDAINKLKEKEKQLIKEKTE